MGSDPYLRALMAVMWTVIACITIIALTGGW